MVPSDWAILYTPRCHLSILTSSQAPPPPPLLASYDDTHRLLVVGK